MQDSLPQIQKSSCWDVLLLELQWHAVVPFCIGLLRQPLQTSMRLSASSHALWMLVVRSLPRPVSPVQNLRQPTPAAVQPGQVERGDAEWLSGAQKYRSTDANESVQASFEAPCRGRLWSLYVGHGNMRPVCPQSGHSRLQPRAGAMLGVSEICTLRDSQLTILLATKVPE